MALSDTIARMFLSQDRPNPGMLGSGTANKAGMVAEITRKIKEAYLAGDDETAMKLQEMLQQMTQSPNGAPMPQQPTGPNSI